MRLTYTARVSLDWNEDRATVLVRGQRYTEPIEGADQAALMSLARRAVRHLFTVDGMSLTVAPDRIRTRGTFVVTAVTA